MSFFSTLKTALSLKEKLAATGVLVLICALVGAGFDDLPAYILDTETMLMGINRKNRNVNDYNRAISGN